NPITFVAPRADDTTQSVLVKATLRQMPASIRIMQYVRARIIWSNDPTIVIPIVAVSRIAGQHFVFVAEQGRQGFVARQKPVTVVYQGASGEHVESAVTTALEQAVNAVEGMVYVASSSANSGISDIPITFDVTRDPDIAAVDVQSRVNQALGRLPGEVRQLAV